MDKSQYIGIVENTDPSWHLEIFDNLYSGNIIITKRLTDKLIDKLVENKDKCILHFTVTGFGNTKVEPFVPSVIQSFKKFNDLIDKGFPIEQFVLRIDPIVPTEKGINTALSVIETFKDSGIKRVRFSVLDMYKHVKQRFEEAGIPIPYHTFHAPLTVRKSIADILAEKGREYGFSVEACGEPGIDSIPCLSQKDIDILGLTDKIKLVGQKEQRTNCHCPSNKIQLYKGKMEHCKNNCLYCYIKD